MIPLPVIKHVLFEFLDLATSLTVAEVFNLSDNEMIWKNKATQYNLKRQKNRTYKSACFDWAQRMCIKCNHRDGIPNDLFDVRICRFCREDKEYKTICKGTAKKNYYLTDKDLDELKCVYAKNPHYRSGPAMTIYAEKDVVRAFCDKYEVEAGAAMTEKLDWLQQQRDQRGKTIKDGKKKNRDARRKELTEAMTKCGLKIRGDSQLCSGYIDGTIKDWSVDAVVHRMCQVKYLFDYCDIDSCFEEAKRRRYQWELYDEPLFDIAEDIALERHGGYPKVFPWLKEKMDYKKVREQQMEALNNAEKLLNDSYVQMGKIQLGLIDMAETLMLNK
jgi:hypothetical protein